MKKVCVNTFGKFELLVNGEPVPFRYAKCRELVAYLVDRHGSSVTRPEVFAVLWEDRIYDRPMQKQLDVIIRSLRATLKDRGIDDILEMGGGTIRIRTEMIDCDLYRLIHGDLDAVNAYQGEYMTDYPWASITESFMTWKWGANESAPPPTNRKKNSDARVTIQTFGSFEVFLGRKTVHFSRSRAKELLAYLVDRKGRPVSRREAFSRLWGDRLYDRPMQKQMDVVVRSLRRTLTEYGIGDILQMEKGRLRVCPGRIDCDLYRFLDGDLDAVNAYRGEYMSAYPWASMTEAYMDHVNGYT